MTFNDLRLLLSSPVDYYPTIAEVSGGVLPGLFLSRCWHLTTHATDPDGWFPMTREEWQADLGMSRSEQETARRYLRERGLLEEMQRRTGFDRRNYYRVNVAHLAVLLNEAAGKRAADAKARVVASVVDSGPAPAPSPFPVSRKRDTPRATA